MTRPRPAATVETLVRGPDGAGGRVRVSGLDEPAVVERIDGDSYRVALGGRRFEVVIAREPDAAWGWVDGRAFRWTHAEDAAGREPGPAGGPRAVRAPMPAVVTAVAVEAGAAVSRGDTLVVLEAMKMELPVKAPHGGRVAAVRCAVGDRVAPDTCLVEVDAGGTPAR